MVLKVLLLVFAGLAVAALYVLFIRAALEKAGILSPLPGHAAGYRDRIAAFVAQSWTIAWQWIVGSIASVFTFVLSFADTIGAPEIKAQVVQVFKDYPQSVSAGFLVVAIITGIARARTLGR